MGRVPPQEQVGRHWSHPRNQERVGVRPADRGAQWQVGHNWAVERAMAVQPLGARKEDVQREKGGSALLTLPKALGLMAAGWERPRHDYFRVAEKNALHLDISAQTVWFSEQDFPVTTSPSTKRSCCYTAWGLRHIGGGFRGSR